MCAARECAVPGTAGNRQYFHIENQGGPTHDRDRKEFSSLPAQERFDFGQRPVGDEKINIAFRVQRKLFEPPDDHISCAGFGGVQRIAAPVCQRR